jgi:hypothetical protein
MPHRNPHRVIPAKAGIHGAVGKLNPRSHDRRLRMDRSRLAPQWVPAFAGMTIE